METAAHELQADYTSLASRSKKITERNEFLENEIVVSSSKLEHERKENEMLLLKLNDLKNLDIERRIELDRISCEKRDLIEKTKLIDSFKATIDNQADEIDMLKSKLNEYVKVSTSIQFYKNKVSLQSEQIASLQSKLRESAHEEILMSSPIHSRSEDITYASSSLRGLQQAVDRSNLLRSTRRSTMEMSQISGDSSRRRREISRRWTILFQSIRNELSLVISIDSVQCIKIFHDATPAKVWWFNASSRRCDEAFDCERAVAATWKRSSCVRGWRSRRW